MSFFIPRIIPRLSRREPAFRIIQQEDEMKRLLSAVLVVLMSQGIARADEPTRDREATKVERIAPQEVRVLRDQPGVVPHATPIPWRRVAIIAALTAGGALLTAVLVSRRAR
jgi:hypothetical protein